MVKKPLILGPYHFSEKGDAEEFLKAMLHKYDVGDRVSAADAEVLHAALALHPNAAAKVGSRYQTFQRQKRGLRTKRFWVNRIDDSSEKFSYKACIYG